MQNDNDIVKYYSLHLINFMLSDKLLQLDYGALYLTPRLGNLARSRMSTASPDALCIGGTSIAAMVEHSPYPAAWAYPSVLFSSSKQKHLVEHIRASVAIIRRLVVFTLVVTVE